jgi:hypothetical protein
MSRQVCPFHSDEDVPGAQTNDVELTYTCERTTGHPKPGPHQWTGPLEVAGLTELGGLADELSLSTELPAAIATYPGKWLEFGVVEAAYADRRPKDFEMLVERYSHTAIAATQFSVSAFLAGVLGRLGKAGFVLYHDGPATGRWNYNGRISWWAVTPEPEWSPDTTVSWAGLGRSMDYVPGSTE